MEGVVVFIIVFAGVIAIAMAKAQSKPAVGDEFICAGCGGSFRHTKRTVAAWVKNIRNFYCGKCHHEWHEQQARKKLAGQGSGCMVTLLCMASVPTAIVTYLVVM